MIKKTNQKILFLVLLSALLFSCTKKNDESNDSKTSAKSAASASTRADERWNALINKEWEKAYSYETPSYRQNYTMDSYRGGFGGAVTWKTVKIISENSINEKLANVKVQLVFTLAEGGKMEIPSMFDERWILTDGTWWHVVQKK